jgi:hypothetical protein
MDDTQGTGGELISRKDLAQIPQAHVAGEDLRAHSAEICGEI